jgi:transcriptional regulator with XRE-family HTH domain
MEHIIASTGQLGTVLHGYRKQRRITQQQAASKVGMRAKTVSRIETGQGAGATLESFLKLLSALDVECVLRPKPQATKTRAVNEPEW